MSDYRLDAFMLDAKERVDARLQCLLDAMPAWTIAERGKEAMRHSVFAGGGGKRLRPVLALLSAQMNNAPTSELMDAVAGIELIHSYTIIIDDIQDDDETRRGAPTAHVLFGINDSLLAAGRLLAEGLILIQAASPVRPRALRDLMHFLHAGQEADLASDNWEEDRKTQVALDFILRGKTGALFELAMLIGAGGDASPELEAQLREIGSEIGLLFQATDDILEATSSSEQLGKPAGKDRGGKLTFVSHFADINECKSHIMARKVALQARVVGIARGDASLLNEFVELTVRRQR